MTEELLRAPQGCFQSLKLTSSLRDCGHRAAIQKQKECSCKICTMCKFLRRLGMVSLCPPDLNGLPSRAHTPVLFSSRLSPVGLRLEAKRMLLRDFVPRRLGMVSLCPPDLNGLPSRAHTPVLFSSHLSPVGLRLEAKRML